MAPDRPQRLPIALGALTLLLVCGLATWRLTGDDDGTGDGEPDRLAFAEEDRAVDDTGRAANRASDLDDAGASTESTATTADAAPDEAEPTDPQPAEAIRPDPDRFLPAQSLVATVVGDGVVATAEPGAAAAHWFPNPTQFGGVRTFLVVDDTSSPDWIKVALPVKPNGQEGWIPRAEVELSSVTHRAVIDLSDDSVTVWHGEDVIVDTRAVTGKPATPTPLGTFYVRDVIAQSDPAGVFGPYVVALSGFSEVLDTFNGGLPALAIHGTNRPDQLGSERSSGCIRIPNDLITLVAESVPLGTPVAIVA
ncbi:MAG: L,D-transpeptidase [Actinomycetota bacterium]